MKITRTHYMTKDEAKGWVDRELSELLDQFGDSVSNVSYTWNGDSMRFSFRAGGMLRFNGTLTVTDTALNLDMPFPLLARGFEARAKTEAELWLDSNLPQS